MGEKIWKGLTAFILWTSFSFGAHYYARTAILRYVNSETGQNHVSRVTQAAVVMVTMCQMAIGSLMLNVVLKLPRAMRSWCGLDVYSVDTSKSNGKSKDSAAMVSIGQKVTLTCSHVMATLCTNASFLFTAPSITFMVKSFEPLTTALLSCLMTGSKIETHIIISLPIVTAGCIGFTTTTDLEMATSSSHFGIALAFLSNVLLGLRNIALKQQTDKADTRLRCLASMSLNSAVFLGMGLVIHLIWSTYLLKMMMSVNGAQLIILSSCFHVIYTFISTCIVLRYISVVGHALANLMKRILVALAFFVIIHQTSSTTVTSWISLCVIIIGLVIYILPGFTNRKLCENQQHLWLTLVLTLTVVAMTTIYIPAPPTKGNPQDVESHSDHHDPYQNMTDNDRNLLTVNLFEYPNKANWLSENLHKQEDVVNEAIRVQNMIFSNVIQPHHKKAVLVNVFEWVNKGDQFITIGERTILQRYNLSIVYYCFYPGDKCDFSKIPRTKDTILFIQGAGYIGHPAHLPVVRKAVHEFQNNRVIMFPTSVCHPIHPCVNISQFAKIYGIHKDCHIMLRDKPSYEMAKHYFKKNRNYLVPDSAFAVGNIRLNLLPVYDIVWIKRNDWEANKADPLPEFPPGITIQVTDWIGDWMKQSGKDFFESHQLHAFSGVLFLARARVIITDRLHAHLISTLLGKPNVVINSRTKKQSNYYMTWERKLTNSYLANTQSEALRKALILLRKHKQTQ